MDSEILKDIGLTNSETKVYLGLLKLGECTRGDIVNESEVASSKIYEVLDKLHDKGLASVYVKNKVKHFRATNPNQIMTYLEEKKKRFSDVEKKVQTLLPELLMSFNSSKEEQEVELLTGFKGLQEIFREQIEIMEKGEINYVIGGTRQIEGKHIYAFFRKIHKLRELKKIKTKMLYNKEQRNIMSKTYPKKEFPETYIKYVETSSPVAINVYKDRTAIIIFGEKISIIHIRSQDVAKSFVEYFELLWNKSKK